MDRACFDNVARTLASRLTRRRATGLLLAMGLGTIGGLQPFGAAEIAARKRRRRKKKRRKNRDKPGQCVPMCADKECGPDGCGGSCGQCPYDYCSNAGLCQDDTCGSCPAGLICHAGACCDPNCYGKVCGISGCGFSCGQCPVDKPLCVGGGFSCVPIPDLP